LKCIYSKFSKPISDSIIADMSSEIHIFIIWNKGRFKEKEIIAYIKQKFIIHQIYEIIWKKENFTHNLSRFYGENLPDASSKVQNCGNGSFLLIIIEDNNPKYEQRQTLSGRLVVNTNIFDAKLKYRKLTGGQQKVHGSISTKECLHALALILEKTSDEFLNKKQWNGEIKEPVGTDNWNSLEQYFKILNNTCKYLVLRSFENLPDKYKIGNEGDIDLLVEDLKEICLISNAKKVDKEEYKVQFFIKIKNDKVHLDFLHVGDGYFDSNWQKNMLKNRKFFKNSFYVSSNSDYFYSLLYHSLIHKKRISDRYKKKLLELANKFNIIKINSSNINNLEYLKTILEKFMMNNRYYCVRPKDKSIYFNEKIFGNTPLLKNEELLNNFEKISSNEMIRLSRASIRIIRSEGFKSLLQSFKAKIKNLRK